MVGGGLGWRGGSGWGERRIEVLGKIRGGGGREGGGQMGGSGLLGGSGWM